VTHRDSYPNIEGMSSTNIFLRIRERNQKICFRQSAVRTILNDLCREYFTQPYIHNQLTSPDVTHRDSYPNIEGMSSTNIFLRIRERNQKICFQQSAVRTILNDLCREYVRIGATGGDLFPKQGQHLL